MSTRLLLLGAALALFAPDVAGAAVTARVGAGSSVGLTASRGRSFGARGHGFGSRARFGLSIGGGDFRLRAGFFNGGFHRGFHRKGFHGKGFHHVGHFGSFGLGFPVYGLGGLYGYYPPGVPPFMTLGYGYPYAYPPVSQRVFYIEPPASGVLLERGSGYGTREGDERYYLERPERPRLMAAVEAAERQLRVENVEPGVYVLRWMGATAQVTSVEFSSRAEGGKVLHSRRLDAPPFRALLRTPDDTVEVVVLVTYRDGREVSVKLPTAEFRALAREAERGQ